MIKLKSDYDHVLSWPEFDKNNNHDEKKKKKTNGSNCMQMKATVYFILDTQDVIINLLGSFVLTQDAECVSEEKTN